MHAFCFSFNPRRAHCFSPVMIITLIWMRSFVIHQIHVAPDTYKYVLTMYAGMLFIYLFLYRSWTWRRTSLTRYRCACPHPALATHHVPLSSNFQPITCICMQDVSYICIRPLLPNIKRYPPLKDILFPNVLFR
jgi:hypothetical protein